MDGWMDEWMIIVVPGCISRRRRRRRGEGVFVDESWYLSSSWLALLHSLELGLVKD
jgi:hypothetical protein